MTSAHDPATFRAPAARTRIKFCGVMRVDDALAAAALGVDAIGLVLTPRSKRCLAPARAREIRDALPPFVTVVTLFNNDDAAFVEDALGVVAPDLVQFHGDEPAQDCVRYGRPYLKSVAMGGGADLQSIVAAHPHAAGFLLDSHAAGGQGGSGKTFDWTLIPKDLPRPWVLAGGLTPDNVGAAVRRLRPFGVDLASGIESAPGIKDAEKMRRFVKAVRECDET
jgi:phosphoribosylanthranilate isomerase